MEIKYIGDKTNYKTMTTAELRESYLLENLFETEKIQLYYVDVDRTIVGSIVPASEKLNLSSAKELAADYFAERREIGVINIGENGTITVDGKQFELKNKDCLYIGRGSKEIAFTSSDANTPAKFYLMSYPAHQTYPTKKNNKEGGQQGGIRFRPGSEQTYHLPDDPARCCGKLPDRDGSNRTG